VFAKIVENYTAMPVGAISIFFFPVSSMISNRIFSKRENQKNSQNKIQPGLRIPGKRPDKE